MLEVAPAFRRAGFTLVELLVVIAIIILMAGLGMVGYNQIGQSSGVGGSVDIVAGMASQARLQAMSLGEGALLAIDVDITSDEEVDPDDRTKWRRIGVFKYVAAVAEDLDATPSISAAPESWALTGKAVLLPQGSYFYEASSDMDKMESMELKFKGAEATDCQVVEFDGVGHVKTPNVKLIFTRAVVVDGDFVTPSADLDAARRGFLLRKNGRPTFFETTDQIDNMSTP